MYKEDLKTIETRLYSAFTMAEILISLTIIGVIAAITLPSLRANINETTWNTQRKALYSRMSQAISMLPSLNGYGDYRYSTSEDGISVTNDTAATAFVTDGLSKVFAINNICQIPLGKEGEEALKELKKCGVAPKITTMKFEDGKTKTISFPTKLSGLNPMFVRYYENEESQSDIDTNAASFETKNGETITVFYNPLCQADMNEKNMHYTQPKMCANFIYDLNGKKGPNKVGKDIGFITAWYSVDSVLVAPMPLEEDAKNGTSTTMPQTAAAAACRSQDENSRVPNRDELSAMFINHALMGVTPATNYSFWSSEISSSDSDEAWKLFFRNGIRRTSNRQTSSSSVRCVKR